MEQLGGQLPCLSPFLATFTFFWLALTFFLGFKNKSVVLLSLVLPHFFFTSTWQSLFVAVSKHLPEYEFSIVCIKPLLELHCFLLVSNVSSNILSVEKCSSMCVLKYLQLHKILLSLHIAVFFSFPCFYDTLRNSFGPCVFLIQKTIYLLIPIYFKFT